MANAIKQKRWQEVADTLEMGFTAEQIKNSNLPNDLLIEIYEDTYSDTDQRDQINNHMTLKYIGMRCPCYGDSDNYKKSFDKKMGKFLG